MTPRSRFNSNCVIFNVNMVYIDSIKGDFEVLDRIEKTAYEGVVVVNIK